jgi:transcriptional regulator with XRE-family HTH domain
MHAATHNLVAFGPRLQALRKRRGLSRADLDAALGLDPGTCAHWENELGSSTVAYAQTILLADYFCITLDQLMLGAPLRREPAFPLTLHQFVATSDGRPALQLNLIRALRYLPCVPSIELYREVVAALEPYVDAIDAIRSEPAAPPALHKLVATAE